MLKRKWLGSLLNFLVPGLGQFYARKTKKGILIYILFFVVVFSLRFISYNFLLFLVSVSLIFGYYLYLIIGGYREVEKSKKYESTRFDRWYVYIIIFLIHLTFVNLIDGRTIDRLTPINFASIPTPAMDPTLQIGDILAFKKTKFIEREDVIIFQFPDDIKTMFIKRCIGIPGDSLKIINSTVLINGVPMTDITLKFKYLLKTNGIEINRSVLDKNKLGENDYSRISSDIYQFYLTERQASDLKKIELFNNIELSVAKEGEREYMIYPKSEIHSWNTDYYGPIYIPKMGDRIQLTEKNIDAYFKCIAFENESVERDDMGLIINGQSTTSYQFKENYYFMMGDNRHNSLDSRYWGFLPHELVIGKALYLYWSQTTDRIGKRLSE